MEYEVIEFETQKEEWNKYEVKDDTILAAKFILERLVHFKDDEGKEGLIPHGKPSFQVWYATDRVSAKERDDDISKIKPEFIDYDQLKEVWNKYHFTFRGGVHQFKVKLSVVAINKYKDKYDKYGYPRYSINKSLQISMKKL